ncbi:MAG: hypothetical protein JSR66_27815 [Proteobacteria bacterium]|nr:hypothetical protein [Pseudomonadota bacterium]
MEDNLGKLHSDVAHIQSDVSEMKVNARDFRKEFTGLVAVARSEINDNLFKNSRGAVEHTDNVRVELSQKIDTVRDRIDSLRSEMMQKFEQVDLRLQLVQSELTRQIDKVKESVHRAKIQNLLWCISLGCAFFYILAHALKWF